MTGNLNDRPSFLAPRSAPAWILFGLVLFNIAVFWISNDENLPEWLQVVLLGGWMFEPMLLAGWTVLGPGAFIIRLSLAIPSLMLLIAAQGIFPGGFQDIEFYEFKVMTIAAFIMFTADLVLLLILRRSFGWRLEPPVGAQQQTNTRFQFDIKYLIILLTLCAVVLGIISNRVFKPPPQPTFAFIFFGPEFFLHIVIIGGTTAFFALRPLAAVPLIVLNVERSKRLIGFALGTWALTSVIIAAVFMARDESAEDVLFGGLLLQSGAVLLGSATAWLLLLAGYRLQSRT